MTTILINYESSRIDSPDSLVLNLADKIDLRRGDARVALSKHLLHMEKYEKVIKIIKSNYQDQYG